MKLTLDNTAIVADSTCDPPVGYLDAHPNLSIVPLRVHFGDETYRDYFDLTPEQFFTKLRADAVFPTTSQPSTADFVSRYRDLREGYEHVLSVHLSGLMSGTVGAAQTAADEVDGVRVYDSRTASTLITLYIDRILERLDEGIELEELDRFIAGMIARGRIAFQVPTLEYLRRGGRIGRASAVVGDVLGIRPIIQVLDGEVQAYAKVRGERRALDTMAAYLEEFSTPDDDILLVTLEGMAADKLPALCERLLAVRPKARVVLEGPVGAVIGTHAGPGVFGFGLLPV